MGCSRQGEMALRYTDASQLEPQLPREGPKLNYTESFGFVILTAEQLHKRVAASISYEHSCTRRTKPRWFHRYVVVRGLNPTTGILYTTVEVATMAFRLEIIPTRDRWKSNSGNHVWFSQWEATRHLVIFVICSARCGLLIRAKDARRPNK